MSPGCIYSIGHGRLSTTKLVEHLSVNQVAYVIDVRSVPYSRYQPEFTREPLATFLSHNRIKYVFMGDTLGGRPKNEDCYTDGKVDYKKTGNQDSFKGGISRLLKAYEQGLQICLLCSEAHPSQCHRTKLIGAALHDKGIEMSHILTDGSLRSQEQVMEELSSRQSSFLEDHFVSRKTYR